jgi:hypothetical protein
VRFIPICDNSDIDSCSCAGTNFVRERKVVDCINNQPLANAEPAASQPVNNEQLI